MSPLFVHAAAVEGAAIEASLAAKGQRSEGLGVGKVAAATALGALLRARRAAGAEPELVCVLGVAGAYPKGHLRAGLEPLEMLEACVVEVDGYADEGVMTPEGFRDLGAMQLGAVGPWSADAGASAKLAEALKCRRVRGATVSTGAGVDGLSIAHALRTGAQVESMEGAALAWVCAELGVPMVQVRVISNRTGARTEHSWDLRGALVRLGAVAGVVAEALAV